MMLTATSVATIAHALAPMSVIGCIPSCHLIGRRFTTVGISRYEELAKGQMLGDTQGMLKLLFDPSTLRLLGVHAIGDRASEIIHIGQAVLSHGGNIGYFRDAVFNYPTLAEAYKVAALDGLNRL